MGVNLDTLRPELCVEGYTTPGGYSSRAVKPIALRMVMEVAQLIRGEFLPSLSAIGGVETGTRGGIYLVGRGHCAGVRSDTGYEHVKPMCEQLLAFMEKHKFEKLSDFKGKSLDYFTTHADLVKRQAERKAAQKAATAAKTVKNDAEWRGDDFSRKQSQPLASS